MVYSPPECNAVFRHHTIEALQGIVIIFWWRSCSPLSLMQVLLSLSTGKSKMTSLKVDRNGLS